MTAVNCKENADCPSGECGVSHYEDGCGSGYGLACRTAEDECRLLSDCDPKKDKCSEDLDTGVWTCGTYTCIP